MDVVAALTESARPDVYFSNLKKRMSGQEGAEELLTKCKKLKLPGLDGKFRGSDCATNDVMFRIIQSIPSKRAEPIKLFLAETGAERLEETVEPSKAVDRAIQDFRRLGRSDEWNDGRIQSISARNELTDEWQDRGVRGRRMATLTNRMGEEVIGVAPTDHKALKRLGERDNLRDHMDLNELGFTTMGERAAKDVILARNAHGHGPTAEASMTGARIIGRARRELEAEINRPIANGGNFLEAPRRDRLESEEDGEG